MMTNVLLNPFSVGDRVTFAPDDHTIGWTYPSFDELRIHPGDTGAVTRIVNDLIYIDDDRGGFSWYCWKNADQTLAEEARKRWELLLAAEREKMRIWRANGSRDV
jgi:hypothetical protein